MKKNVIMIAILFLFWIQTGFAQNFDVPILVSDGIHQKTITIGVSPDATDGFDVNLDLEAPPPAPSGTFDARESWDDIDYIIDYRANTLDEKVFRLEYQAAEGAGPIILTWDSACLPYLGTIEIVDATTGGILYTQDMSLISSLDTSMNVLPYGQILLESVKIKITPTQPNPPVVSQPIADQNVVTNFATYTVAELTTVFTDSDSNEPLSYQALSDGNTIPFIEGTSLRLSSIFNVVGTSQVVVCVSDCQRTTCDTFLVNIADNQPPNQPSSPSPSDAATGVSVAPTLTWIGGDPDNGDIVTYDVYLGIENSLQLVSDGQSETTYVPGTLDNSTLYYWKIVATDNHDASTEGEVWSFTTGDELNQAPYQPSSPDPSDGATGVSISPTLSWTGGDPNNGDTVTYDVYFGTTYPPQLVSEDQSETTYNPGTLEYSTPYYWKIVATDNHDASTEGEVWSLTTLGNVAPTITIIEPDGNNDVAIDSYLITWTDSDPDDNAMICLYYDDDNSGYNGTEIVCGLLENEDGPNDTYSWDVSLLPDGDYYIHANISDSVNPPLKSYSDGPITINHDQCDAPQNLVVTGIGDQINLEWDPPFSPGEEIQIKNDNSTPESYFNQWTTGDKVAARLETESSNYPISIQTIQSALYDFNGIGSTQIRFWIYSVALDGSPSTVIYQSLIFTITDFYTPGTPQGFFVDISDGNIIVDEPIFVVLEFVSGSTGSIPSTFTDSQDGIPVGKNYYYFNEQWREHYAMWNGAETMGYNMIGVTAITSNTSIAMMQNNFLDYPFEEVLKKAEFSLEITSIHLAQLPSPSVVWPNTSISNRQLPQNYFIYHQLSGQAWNYLTSVDGVQTSYTDSPTMGGNWCYRVVSVCENGQTSSPSNSDCATVNLPPEAVDDNAQVDEDTPIIINVLENDSDPENDALIVVSTTNASHGSIQIHFEQAITYNPNPNYNGTDSFEYSIQDEFNDAVFATVYVTVNPVNDAPVATDDLKSTPENTLLNIPFSELLDNDVDVDNEELTITAVANSENGVVILNVDDITFTPGDGFIGQAGFDYTISDGELTDVGHVAITVSNTNNPPIAENDAFETDEDIPLNLTINQLLVNDSDPDGTNPVLTNLQNGTHGIIQLVGNQITFTPTLNYYGEAGFEYIISDGSLTAVGEVSITINAVNDPPVAANDDATITSTTAIEINVLANDTDVENDNLTIANVSAPSHGFAEIYNTVIRYEAAEVFTGTDEFTYTISDGNDTDYGFITVYADFQLGDVDGNGTISDTDIELVIHHIMGTNYLSPAQQILADVNNDGETNIIDLLLLLGTKNP